MFYSQNRQLNQQSDFGCDLRIHLLIFVHNYMYFTSGGWEEVDSTATNTTQTLP
jgi:hypothetical protein